jgi:hypothetical protein
LTEREEVDKPAVQNASQAMGLDASVPGPNTSASSPTFRTSYEDLRDRLTATGAGTTPGTTTPEKVVPQEQQPGQPAAKEPKPAARGTGTQPTWQERMKQLREKLEQGEAGKGVAKPEGGGSKEPEKAKGTVPGAEPATSEPGKSSTGPAPAPAKQKSPLAMAGMDEETLELIRKAGGEAKTYAAGAPGSLFEVHLKAGEEELAKGRYFDAEERFSRALAMRPGDATVQAARLNAQIGAGLYISAATNLRQVFRQHPEVIGVHYTGSTMPAQERLNATMAEMRENISKTKQGGLAVPEEAGLLLAYVGYQSNDPGAVREGLDAMRQTKDGASDPLVPLLAGVWLGRDAK